MNRKQVEAWQKTVNYGYICEQCQLSDFGFARMKSTNFDPNPCNKCIDHFYPKDK